MIGSEPGENLMRAVENSCDDCVPKPSCHIAKLQTKTCVTRHRDAVPHFIAMVRPRLVDRARRSLRVLPRDFPVEELRLQTRSLLKCSQGPEPGTGNDMGLFEFHGRQTVRRSLLLSSGFRAVRARGC